MGINSSCKGTEMLFGWKGRQFNRTPGQGKGADELMGEIFKIVMKRTCRCVCKLSSPSYFKL